jgi:hypothetical protein
VFSNKETDSSTLCYYVATVRRINPIYMVSVTPEVSDAQ